MVPIIDLIPEKFDTQIGKDTLVSLWLLLTKERGNLGRSLLSYVKDTI
jgi:hypothetical protein